MNQNATLLLTFAIIALVLVFRVMRMRKEQRFGIVTMWVIPAILAALTIGTILVDRLTTAVDIAFALVALAIGVAIGWYQGSHTTVRVDRNARAMFVRVSPIGIAIFVGVLVLRMGIRTMYGGAVPTTPPTGGTINLVSALMLFVVVGMVAGLRAYLTRAYRTATAAGDSGVVRGNP